MSSSGDVWVGDVANDRVEEFSEQGKYLRQVGARGSATGQFGLAPPMGLAVLPNGELWLTDAGNDRLERFNEHGEYLEGHCTAISGVTSSTYSPTAADVGFTLQAIVMAADVDGETDATSLPTVVVSPGPTS